jgi:DNA invertase Pin-like site-specific DNA recombinase
MCPGGLSKPASSTTAPNREGRPGDWRPNRTVVRSPADLRLRKSPLTKRGQLRCQRPVSEMVSESGVEKRSRINAGFVSKNVIEIDPLLTHSPGMLPGIEGEAVMQKRKSMRVAIYCRVSTTDKGQDPQNQLLQLRDWCRHAGHEIVGEYVDHVSGRKGAGKRKQFDALFADASKRKFDIVLVWALDRFSREGMRMTVRYLEMLNEYGAGFHSYQEPLLSTDNEMIRDIILAVMAALAKQESIKIGDRTKAGLARVAKQGHFPGRPKIEDSEKQAKQYRKARDMLAAGAGTREVARECKMGPVTVRRIRDEMSTAAGS